MGDGTSDAVGARERERERTTRKEREKKKKEKSLFLHDGDAAKVLTPVPCCDGSPAKEDYELSHIRFTLLYSFSDGREKRASEREIFSRLAPGANPALAP